MPDDPEGTLSRVGTPQAAALAWVDAVMDAGDLARAWPLTDPLLRLVLVQEWLWDRRGEFAGLGDDRGEVAGLGDDRDEVAGLGGDRGEFAGLGDDRDETAAALAACPPDHPLWERFAADRVAGWRRVWRGFGTDAWVVRGEAEVVDIDLELVTFVEWAAAAAPPGEAPGPFARRFLLRHTAGGWLVAGLTATQRFRPGWPPAPA